MPKFPDISPLNYLQERGLRILASEAFKFFYEYLDETPGNYLEIGVFEGYMLRELAKLYPVKMFYGIDPFIEDGHTSGHNGGVPTGEFMHDQCAIAHRNTEDVPNIKLFQEPSRLWGARKTDVDLCRMDVTAVFVDGNHSYEEAVNDLLIAERLLCYGGVMYVDDAELPSVKKALTEFSHPMELANGGAIIRL